MRGGERRDAGDGWMHGGEKGKREGENEMKVERD